MVAARTSHLNGHVQNPNKRITIPGRHEWVGVDLTVNQFGLPKVSLGSHWFNGREPGDTWFEVVPFSAITAAPDNPKGRDDINLKKSQVKKLQDSIAEIGEICMGVLTPTYEIVDCHRRQAAKKGNNLEMGWFAITSRDKNKLYSHTQVNHKPHTTCELLEKYLANEMKLSPKQRSDHQVAECLIGRPMLIELQKEGLSYQTFKRARQVAGICGAGNDGQFINRYLKWSIRHKQGNDAEQLRRKAMCKCSDLKERKRNLEEGVKKFLLALAKDVPLKNV